MENKRIELFTSPVECVILPHNTNSPFNFFMQSSGIDTDVNR